MRYKLFLAAFCIYSVISLAQTDTTYYRKYSNRLVVGLFQAARSYRSEFSQAVSFLPANISTNLSYRADADLVTGIELAYDKLALSLGFRTTSAEDQFKKGKTNYSNFSLSFGSKWLLEASYRYYKGFYDLNTVGYDTSYRPTKPYFQNPSMSITTYRTKFIYFLNNKKFSYPAAYSFNMRQYKTAFTWAIISNIYYNNMSTDSSFIPLQARKYYNEYGNMDKLTTTGISLGGGASATIVVFKRVFFNALFLLGPESQWREYGYTNRASQSLNYIVFTGDLRFALGFNSQNFYIAATSSNDLVNYDNSTIKIRNQFASVLLHIGYRFKVKEPKFMPVVRENKIYKWF